MFLQKAVFSINRKFLFITLIISFLAGCTLTQNNKKELFTNSNSNIFANLSGDIITSNTGSKKKVQVANMLDNMNIKITNNTGIIEKDEMLFEDLQKNKKFIYFSSCSKLFKTSFYRVKCDKYRLNQAYLFCDHLSYFRGLDISQIFNCSNFPYLKCEVVSDYKNRCLIKLKKYSGKKQKEISLLQKCITISNRFNFSNRWPGSKILFNKYCLAFLLNNKLLECKNISASIYPNLYKLCYSLLKDNSYKELGKYLDKKAIDYLYNSLK